MSNFKLTTDERDKIVTLLDLLSSDIAIVDNTYEINKNDRPEIYIDLPLFNSKSFHIEYIFDYIETSKLISISGLQQQLISNLEIILNVDFNKQQIFKGWYYINSPDKNYSAKVIDDQIKQDNLNYYQNIIKTLIPLMENYYNEYIIHNYNYQLYIDDQLLFNEYGIYPHINYDEKIFNIIKKYFEKIGMNMIQKS